MTTLERFDVIVVGLGAMGSATVCQLALRGHRVLGLDREPVGHVMGSSHGDSRIIREIYYERPFYVPIVRRAYELWRQLEARTGRDLLQQTGGLMIGPAGGTVLEGTRRSAEAFGIPHEMLSANEIRYRFPAFQVRESDMALLDARSGFLRPEACIEAHLAVATEHGATLRRPEAMVSWAADGDGVRVVTSQGTYAADRLVLAAGAYMRALVGELALPLVVERQVLFWFDPVDPDGRYDVGQLPIYLYDYAPGKICYGFPRLPRGVKASVHHEGDTVDDPYQARRTVRDDEVEPLREALAGILPELARAPARESSVCLFTNMPDFDFLIDFHPNHRQVLIVSPCSGHGFKFASAIGEISAELITEGRSAFDMTPFRLARNH